jgi:hypothetical protein
LHSRYLALAPLLLLADPVAGPLSLVLLVLYLLLVIVLVNFLIAVITSTFKDIQVGEGLQKLRIMAAVVNEIQMGEAKGGSDPGSHDYIHVLSERTKDGAPAGAAEEGRGGRQQDGGEEQQLLLQKKKAQDGMQERVERVEKLVEDLHRGQQCIMEMLSQLRQGRKGEDSEEEG